LNKGEKSKAQKGKKFPFAPCKKAARFGEIKCCWLKKKVLPL
jgi:hypothetical protein